MIPVRIHPLFWVFAGVIGWLSSQSLTGTLIWIGIIFFSVLIHEMGHALMAILFRQKVQIQLIAMGGVTTFEGPKLKFWQQFLITFNGPLFGFFLFLLATALLHLTLPPLMTQILKMTQFANLFWTVVNLLPVLPLDGGQLLRIVLEACFGVKGFKASLLIGALIATLFALYFFMVQSFLLGSFFFLFAYQSFDTWRKSRFVTTNDRDEEIKQLMIQAEQALQEGNAQQAKTILEEVRSKAALGMMGRAATEYLAFLALKEGHKQEAYDLLLPIKDNLTDDSLVSLQLLAIEHQNDSVVRELSLRAYQIAPTQKIAMGNARAFAKDNQAKAAGGWLQTAWHFGELHLETLLQEEAFAQIKDNPDFKEFLDQLK